MSRIPGTYPSFAASEISPLESDKVWEEFRSKFQKKMNGQGNWHGRWINRRRAMFHEELEAMGAVRKDGRYDFSKMIDRNDRFSMIFHGLKILYCISTFIKNGHPEAAAYFSMNCSELLMNPLPGDESIQIDQREIYSRIESITKRIDPSYTMDPQFTKSLGMVSVDLLKEVQPLAREAVKHRMRNRRAAAAVRQVGNKPTPEEIRMCFRDHHTDGTSIGAARQATMRDLKARGFSTSMGSIQRHTKVGKPGRPPRK